MREVLDVVVITVTASALATSTALAAPQIEWDPKIQQFEIAAKAQLNPERWYLLAEYCSQKANDTTLPKGVARDYVIRALEADDRALGMNQDYYDAILLKSVLLRQRVHYEEDPSVRRRLAAEADVYSARADDLQQRMLTVRSRYTW
jgi:hypothetical protein